MNFVKRIVLIIALVLTLPLHSCSNKPGNIPDDLPQTEEIYDMNWFLKYNSEFSYIEGTDNVTAIKQGLHSDVFSNIRIYDGYLYVNFQGDTMRRLNPSTGNITAVCQKPTCFHNTKDCPFYALNPSEFKIFKNKIYFSANKERRGESGTGWGYYVYDLENDSISRSTAKRSDSTMFVGEVLLTSDGYQYYYDLQYDEVKDQYHYYICRYSLDSGKTDVLAEPEDGNTVLVDKIDGVLYYLDGIGFGIYHENTGEKEQTYKGYVENAGHDGEYFYFRDEKEYLYRMPIGSSTAEQLTDFPVRYYYLTDQYIYYRIREKVIIGKYEDGSDADIESQKVFRMNKDGTGQEVVWEFKDELNNMNCDYFVVLGNYLYSKFYYWDDSIKNFVEYQNIDENGNAYLLRIDLINKKTFFIDITP